MTIVPATALSEALAAAGRDIPTVPTCFPKGDGACAVHLPAQCPKPGKRAIWSKKDATTDAATIRARYRRWPLAGVKWLPRVDYVVIDVDMKNGGVETTTRWVLEHGALPPTWADANGHDAGGHYVVTVPGGFDGVLVLGRGVEAFGRGSEIVMPPSPHYLGARRSWRPGRSPSEVEVAAAPSWLVSKIKVAQLHQLRPRSGSGGPLTAEEIAEFELTFSGIGVESRGRAKGVCYCPFHDDRSPSLSVDWSSGLFKCHAASCDAQGGLRALRRLVEGPLARDGTRASRMYSGPRDTQAVRA